MYSLLSFMKKNGYSFDKRGFESLMKRIDRKAKGRVSHVDLKFFLLSNEAFQEPNQSFSYHERTHNHSKSIFDNLSPIKSSKASPQKNANNEIRIPSHEAVNRKAESKSPAKRTRNERSPEIRIPEEPLKTFSTNYEQPVQTNASYEDRFNSRSKYLNQSRAETNFPRENTRNPMEWRYLDPVYSGYWNQNRDHNKTLSPEYFHKIQGQNLLDTFRKNTFLSATGRNNPYFNPGFVEQSTSENFQRFPFNPFRYTDHEHYFQGYYGNLRNNYYDRHYHHTPYATKVSPQHSKMSPIKIKNGIQRELKFTGTHRRFDSGVSIPPAADQLALYQHFQAPPNLPRKFNNVDYDLQNPLDERLQSIQEQQPSVYRNETRGAASEKLTLDDFLYENTSQKPTQKRELPKNSQPYTFVVKNA